MASPRRSDWVRGQGRLATLAESSVLLARWPCLQPAQFFSKTVNRTAEAERHVAGGGGAKEGAQAATASRSTASARTPASAWPPRWASPHFGLRRKGRVGAGLGGSLEFLLRDLQCPSFSNLIPPFRLILRS